ncbi:MAG: sialidase [Flavobacteriales bacterium]|jgi:hypothetical protein|nr:sialidase [Flavobacteriales bacterium]
MKNFAIILSLLSIFSCTSKDIIIEDISFLYDNSNAQPSLTSSNGSLALTWISSDKDMNASLIFRQFKNKQWTNSQTLAIGSDWFINWADFPTHAINGDRVLTSYLKKSASGTYTYDVFLNLQKLSGEKIKEDFILNTDGFKAEHGFVSIAEGNNEGFFITWLDGRNTVEKELNGNHKPMTIRFAEITTAGDIVNEIELDSSVCDCCQTSITNTDKGPIVVYRDRSDKEIRDIYVTRNIDDGWETPVPVYNDEWEIYGCPVNGPKVVSNSNNLAVSWFTVADGKPSVNLSFSESYGSSFSNPIKINDYTAIGRVDVAFLNDNEVLVSYMEVDDVGTYLRLKKVSIDGKVSKPITISKIDSGRNTGVPQLEILDNEIFIVWTVFENDNNQLKTVKLSSKDV